MKIRNEVITVKYSVHHMDEWFTVSIKMTNNDSCWYLKVKKKGKCVYRESDLETADEGKENAKAFLLSLSK